MKPLPQSGTGPRSFLLDAADAIPGLTIGRTVTSSPAQIYLGNQALAPVLRDTNPRRDAIIQILMGEPRLQLQAPR